MQGSQVEHKVHKEQAEWEHTHMCTCEYTHICAGTRSGCRQDIAQHPLQLEAGQIRVEVIYSN